MRSSFFNLPAANSNTTSVANSIIVDGKSQEREGGGGQTQPITSSSVLRSFEAVPQFSGIDGVESTVACFPLELSQFGVGEKEPDGRNDQFGRGGGSFPTVNTATTLLPQSLYSTAVDSTLTTTATAYAIRCDNSELEGSVNSNGRGQLISSSQLLLSECGVATTPFCNAAEYVPHFELLPPAAILLPVENSVPGRVCESHYGGGKSTTLQKSEKLHHSNAVPSAEKPSQLIGVGGASKTDEQKSKWRKKRSPNKVPGKKKITKRILDQPHPTPHKSSSNSAPDAATTCITLPSSLLRKRRAELEAAEIESKKQQLLESHEPVACSRCTQPIRERTLLIVDGGYHHCGCVNCAVCAKELESFPTCFTRDGGIYCRSCYSCKFYPTKCTSCSRQIQPTDWVRRAKSSLYHLACFACEHCKRQLSTGEEFSLQDNRLLCKQHYLELVQGEDCSSKHKTKRVRTTFGEEQITILQAHFQIDSNPDGADLERIANLTGLSKRVTQVWFQNSRARQKKYQGTGPSSSRSRNRANHASPSDGRESVENRDGDKTAESPSADDSKATDES